MLTEQLVIGLKTDTLRLQRAINDKNEKIKGIDSLFFLLQKPVASANTKTIQQLIVNCYTVRIFNASKGAITAIEKELNIKQFANSQLPILLAQYEDLVEINKESEDLLVRLIEQNIEPFTYKHFTPANVYSVLAKDSTIINGDMRNLTQEDMTELSVRIEMITALERSGAHLEQQIKTVATKIIKYAMEHFDIQNSTL